MRTAHNKNAFTPFGLWIQEYLPHNFSVTNLDFVIEDYKRKRLMLLEEKQCGGVLHNAQRMTFQILDIACGIYADQSGYDYWGFYVLQFPSNCTMPGPGMKLNGVLLTVEQLRDHLSFEKRHCEPVWPHKSRAA